MHSSKGHVAGFRFLGSRQERPNRASRFRHRALARAAVFLLGMAASVTVAAPANAQSWWKPLEQTGKKIFDRKINEMSRSSEGQEDPKSGQGPFQGTPADSQVGTQRSGHFELEGIHLDMTPSQVESALTAKGYKRGANTFVKGGTSVRVKYGGGATQQRRVESITLMAATRSTEEDVALRQSLVGKYGEGTECDDLPMFGFPGPDSCAWVKETADGIERLTWARIPSSITMGIRRHKAQAPGPSTGNPPGSGSNPSPASASRQDRAPAATGSL